jgi:two-component system response regulator AtoC
MAEQLGDSCSIPYSAVTSVVRRTSSVCVSVMVVDNDPRMLRYIKTILENEHRQIISCETGEQALKSLANGIRPHIVLASTTLPDLPSSELLSRVRKTCPGVVFSLIAHVYEYANLLPVLREGVQEVLFKPFVASDLLRLVTQLNSARVNYPEAAGKEVPIGRNSFFVYSSAAMSELKEHAALVAPFNLPVLILGESGTGKEVLARYIHSLSQQSANIFMKVNCAAVPSELLESELFGYESGAFTGAAKNKPGKFRLCNNGTMFLDEIGEMHPHLQAKLLQVLQDGSFSPLGSRTTEKVNVRMLAATNIDMKAAIADKTFREDLYYRLNGFCLRLPPLRERLEELPVLIEYFLKRYTRELELPRPLKLSSRFMQACSRYQWPGNLRELESFIKRYLVLGDEQLMINELTEDAELIAAKSTALSSETISQALLAAGGNRRKAALALGINYKVLLRRLRALGMDSVPAAVGVF